MAQKKPIVPVLLTLLLLFILATDAHAYLDAGITSYMLQIILGLLAGGAIFLKTYWRRITNIFSSNKDTDDGAKK